MPALDRPATEAEIRRMQERLQEALDAGAIGLSTGLFYAPAFHAPPAEIEALAALLKPAGALYTTHMRDEAEHVLDSLDESFRCRPRRRGAGRHLAPQDHRRRQFRPHRRDPAEDPGGDGGAGGRARRLPLHRLVDRAPGAAHRGIAEGADHLVKADARAGRTRIGRRSPPIGASAWPRRPSGCSRPARSIS